MRNTYYLGFPCVTNQEANLRSPRWSDTLSGHRSSMNVDAPNVVRFGAFELDLRAHELRKHGLKVSLPEQSVQILSMLVKRSGKVVLREEIRKRLWPNDTIVEFDHSINAAINRLRSALGDEASAPRHIETLPRRGYRFLVAVECVGSSCQPPTAETWASEVKAIGAAHLLGKKISHYRVLEILGGGGMGVVYKAEDIKLGRRVAVKFLPEELANDRTALDRFEREARAASALEHPNICPIYEFGEHAGQPFIVMQLLQGQTLRDRIATGHLSGSDAAQVVQSPASPTGAPGISSRAPQGVPLQIDELLNIAIQVADGLEAAHRKGIIHRDIKPANIFISYQGETKILDFGVAKLAEIEVSPDVSHHLDDSGVKPLADVPPGGTHKLAADPNLTRTGLVLGTAPYMSPEQVRGSKVDTRTDLFSFGLVLYEMATGRQAFRGETGAVIRDAILNCKPAPAADLNPELPLKLGEIIDRALQKDCEARYQAAAEMHRDLKAVRAGSSVPIPEKSIAVLPFANLSPDPENDFFADGISEEITNALAQIERLHVAARSSAFSFKGKHADLRVIGGQLNVKTILEGSVRRAGNHLRITVQLVNVADGYHLWSERYDREMKDVFEVQEEIARAIAGRLKVTLEGGGQEPLVKAATKSLEAYQLYLKGRGLLYRRGGAVPRAVECFEKAVALDPEYALACAGLADSYTVLGYYGVECPEACVPRGLEAARRAVTLDPSLAEAHTALAMASLMGDWNKAEAESEFLRALELNPRYIQARDWYALFYLQLSVGRLEEGVAQAGQALDCDPLSSYANTIFGFTCCIAGRYAEGLQACERGVELDSESYVARWAHQCAQHLSGRFEEAVHTGELALAMSGRHAWAMAVLAVTLADSGRSADAEALYAELAVRRRRSYQPPSWLALAAAAAGVENEAFRHVREACESRDPISIALFSKWFRWNTRLRAYPRVCDVLAGTGLE